MFTTRARSFAAALALACLAPATAVHAQTTTSDVVVTGRRADQTRQFVSSVAFSTDQADQLARWDRSICTSIAGLPARQGQFVADRIAQRAAAVGLQPGQPGCNPNISVIVARDANAAARRLSEEQASLFGRRESNMTTLDDAAFRRFLDNERPVRWWHVAQRLSADGMLLNGDTAVGGLSNAPVARSGGSRLRNDTREDLNRVMIIVDASRVGNVQMAALADYVALVALAQINPDADTSRVDSVLNVFNGGGATEMTAWDTAFLSGLYSTARELDSLQQQRDIARRMESGGGA